MASVTSAGSDTRATATLSASPRAFSTSSAWRAFGAAPPGWVSTYAWRLASIDSISGITESVVSLPEFSESPAAKT